MPENNVKKIEVEHASYAEVSSPEGERDVDFLVTSIGSSKRCINKYELSIPVANVSKCLGMSVEEFFSQPVFTDRDMKGQDVVNLAFRNISTKPTFDLFVDKEATPVTTIDPAGGSDFVDYPLKPNGHADMQALMNGYKVGQRASGGPTQKVKAAKYDKLAAEKAEAEALGIDIEALIAKAKAKAKK